MLLLTALLLAAGPAEDVDAPVVFSEDFEQADPKWQMWARNAADPCTVHFVGATADKAASGKRSAKFDLTFKDGTYCYWGLPVHVPAAGDLVLSGSIFVETLPAGCGVGLGWNVILPPSGHSGCSTIETLYAPTRGWKRFQVRLQDIGEQTARGVLGTPHVLRYVDRVAVMFYGDFRAGRRIVVYVDDLKIAGRLPPDYEATMKTVLEKGKAEHAANTRAWAAEAQRATQAIDTLRSRAAALPGPVGRHARQCSAAAVTMARQCLAEIDRLRQSGQWLLPSQQNAWNERLQHLATVAQTLQDLADYASQHSEPFVVYTRPAITDLPLRPRDLPVAARVGSTVRLSAAPGEYESGTFAIFALQDLRGIRLEATDLTGPAGSIPAAAVDLSVVKVWYQAGIDSISSGSRQPVLVPELLLKDDDLIRVETSPPRNLMRHPTADGRPQYVCISDPDPARMPDVAPQDARSLQPFDVPADSLKQVWLTVCVPDRTPAGRYQGVIHIRPTGTPAGQVQVELRVWPFTLQPSRLVQSIYYRGRLGPNRHPHKVNSEWKTEAQLQAELHDMRIHGLNNPSSYQTFGPELDKVLELRRRAGFTATEFFTLGQGTGSGSDPEHLAGLAEAVRRWHERLSRYGYQKVFFYGADEATGERLRAQRPSWQAVRQAGGGVFVAGYRGSFEAVGDLQDVLVFAGPPDPDEAAKYHRVGHRIFSYANPQCGCEQPARYRRNYGLLLWKKCFDGAMDYAYQHSFGHIWNDFDDPACRDHVMAYPTLDGVIDTLQWEGYREGVDDTRYLATLQEALQAAPAEKKSLADAARKWLDDLDIDADLDAIRAQMAEWIMKLQGHAGRDR